MAGMQAAKRAARSVRVRVPASKALVPAACLALCACSVTNLSVPAHPSAAEDTHANAALAGRPAIVTVHSGDEVEEQPVTLARFDEEGNLAVGKPHTVDSPVPAWGRTVVWSSVPREDLVEVSTIDHERGALRGLVAGAVLGFVTTTAGIYLMFDNHSCTKSSMHPTCAPQNDGALLAGSALVGLGAALVTGGVGALIGYIVGDGANVKISPEEPRTVAAARVDMER